MANTYVSIQTITANGTSATVQFSSIPQTYTDLIMLLSSRISGSSENVIYNLRFNGISTSTYSKTSIRGTGSSASSARETNVSAIQVVDFMNSGTHTASTFGTGFLYFPSYTTATNNKQSFGFGANETDATAASMSAHAGLWRNTAAITSISLATTSGTSIASGSTFYLYGIKKD